MRCRDKQLLTTDVFQEFKLLSVCSATPHNIQLEVHVLIKFLGISSTAYHFVVLFGINRLKDIRVEAIKVVTRKKHFVVGNEELA
jgi:hypothetical protein